jgi:tripartite-type tricarboxylate transporter receptor subunit TctC
MVCTLYNYPNVIVTRSGAWKDLREFVAAAQKSPGELKAAVVLGGASYFFILDLMDTTKTELKLVPYNGHAERVNAVLGSFADITESAPTTVASMMRAKKLVPLAMFTEDRDPVYPDVPTAIEQGFDITFVSHYVLCVPKDTPDDIVKRLDEASKKVTADPEVISKLVTAGSPVFYQPSSEIKAHMNKALVRYRELAAKFKLDAVKKQ